uniref:Uncharacterized protein n=1 Tax=Nelumbo nucifera TaxID=4432 RepID=A0A822ZSW8_NELNU|nr:TPA_asm: hypothetical protein HUJ06_016588 [Nelumbo nucifera]
MLYCSFRILRIGLSLTVNYQFEEPIVSGTEPERIPKQQTSIALMPRLFTRSLVPEFTQVKGDVEDTIMGPRGDIWGLQNQNSTRELGRNYKFNCIRMDGLGKNESRMWEVGT